MFDDITCEGHVNRVVSNRNRLHSDHRKMPFSAKIDKSLQRLFTRLAHGHVNSDNAVAKAQKDFRNDARTRADIQNCATFGHPFKNGVNLGQLVGHRRNGRR